MAATKAQALWAAITDLIALNRNADDAFQDILLHCREPTIIAAAGRGRRELEKERRQLIAIRDQREDAKE